MFVQIVPFYRSLTAAVSLQTVLERGLVLQTERHFLALGLRATSFGELLFFYFWSICLSLSFFSFVCQLSVNSGQALSILSNYPLSGLQPPQGKPVFFWVR